VLYAEGPDGLSEEQLPRRCAGDADVRHLERHSYSEGKVGKVELAGSHTVREFQPTQLRPSADSASL
jgi:hypothetical protein